MKEPRVDDVEYVLRQKPKCGVPIPDTDPVRYSEFAQVTEDEQGNFVCPEVEIPGTDQTQVQSVMLPLLCPYLSKTELDANGATTDNSIPAFHGPLTNWKDKGKAKATSHSGLVFGQCREFLPLDRQNYLVRLPLPAQTPSIALGQCQESARRTLAFDAVHIPHHPPAALS